MHVDRYRVHKASSSSATTSLMEIMSRNDLFTRLFGISICCKAKNVTHYRAYILMVLLWIDLIYSILIVFIPVDQQKVLLLLGSIPFHLLNRDRHFLTAVTIFYRLYSTMMVTYHCSNNFQWLHNVNSIYLQLNSSLLSQQIQKLVFRCQTLLLISFASMFAMVSLGMIASTIHYGINNHFHYNILFPCIYLVFFSFVYTGLSTQLLMQMYFLSKICVEIFDAINVDLFQELILFKRHNRFRKNLKQFSQTCYLVYLVNIYIGWNYVIYFVCSLPIIAVLIYTCFFSVLTIVSQVGFLVLLSYIIFSLIHFSAIIGQIDVHAKKVSDHIYREYIVINKHYNFTNRTFFQVLYM